MFCFSRVDCQYVVYGEGQDIMLVWFVHQLYLVLRSQTLVEGESGYARLNYIGA